eukprot:TRINITY_DN6210_c0_g1_i3.p1 TRINITY_DN6210_c0_g1~~TRINITY_DN6210_c0_g1_i3.p1  ORF type:complete len:426 (-),score=72.17 TRINITY_DN6210_c0_g1_i3:134-1249(-)
MTELLHLSDDHVITALSFLPATQILLHISPLSRRFAQLATAPSLWRHVPLHISHDMPRERFCCHPPLFRPGWSSVSKLTLDSDLLFKIGEWASFVSQFRALKHLRLQNVDVLDSVQSVTELFPSTPHQLESLHISLAAMTLVHRSDESFCLLDWLSHFPALRAFSLSAGYHHFPAVGLSPDPTAPTALAVSRPQLTELALHCRTFAREWLTAFPTLTSLTFRVGRDISAFLPELGSHLPALQQLTLTCSDFEVDVIPHLAHWAQSMPHLHTLTLIMAHTVDRAISVTILRNVLLFFTVPGCWPALQVLELRCKKFTADPNMEEHGVLPLLPTMKPIVLRSLTGVFEPEFQQQMLTVLPAEGVKYMGAQKRL